MRGWPSSARFGERLRHRNVIFDQERRGEVDNLDYFAAHWLVDTRQTQRIVHRPGDHLLVGAP